MTTVVYRDGILAFDSMVTSIDGEAERKDATMLKGIKTKTHIIAGSGDIEYIQAFFKWAKSGFKNESRPIIQRNSEFQMIVIDFQGKITIYNDNLLPQKMNLRPKGCYASGSGADLAIGAMAAGASALEAIRIAAKYNPATGGRIRTLTWRTDEKDQKELKEKMAAITVKNETIS